MLDELRYAARSLIRERGFTLAVVLTLGLAIGPLVGILGVANWLLLRPVPGVGRPNELVLLEIRYPNDRGGYGYASLSSLNRADLLTLTPSVAGLVGYSNPTVSVAASGIAPRRLEANVVDGDYFSVLQVSVVGRAFTSDDDRAPGGNAVTVVSRQLYRELFNREPGSLGEALTINGLPFVIVGVAPEGFRGTQPSSRTDLWLPGAVGGLINHTPPPSRPPGRGRGQFIRFIGRLARGATVGRAAIELQTGLRRLAEEYPADNAAYKQAFVDVAAGLGVPISERSRARILVMSLAAVGTLIVFIAVANVANLIVFRSARRRMDVVVRRALGASRWDLWRRDFLHTAGLALPAGVSGVIFSQWCIQLIDGIRIPGLGELSAAIDWRTNLMAGILCMILAVVLGSIPTLFGERVLSAASLRVSHGTVRQHLPRLRGALTIVQLSLSIGLLVGALLLVSTVRTLRSVDLGFDPAGVSAQRIDLRSHGYSDERARTFYQSLVARVEAAPEIEAFGISQNPPLSDASYGYSVRVEGADSTQTQNVTGNGVTCGYFKVLRLRVLHGRTFDDDECLAAAGGAITPVIVSESLAKQLYNRSDVVGQRLILPKNALAPERSSTVIGVVADSRWVGLTESPTPMLYLPLGSIPYGLTNAAILARSPRPVASAAATMQRLVSSLDPDVPLFQDRPLTAFVEQQFAEQRVLSRLLLLLATLALVVSAIGLYGLIAETVHERQLEFGIRAALGAAPRAVAALVLRQGAWLTFFGVVGGVVAGAAVARLIQSQLVGVNAFDISTFAFAAGSLAVISLTATAIPVLRTIRMDVSRVLRTDSD